MLCCNPHYGKSGKSGSFFTHRTSPKFAGLEQGLSAWTSEIASTPGMNRLVGSGIKKNRETGVEGGREEGGTEDFECFGVCCESWSWPLNI